MIEPVWLIPALCVLVLVGVVLFTAHYRITITPRDMIPVVVQSPHVSTWWVCNAMDTTQGGVYYASDANSAIAQCAMETFDLMAEHIGSGHIE